MTAIPIHQTRKSQPLTCERCGRQQATIRRMGWPDRFFLLPADAAILCHRCVQAIRRAEAERN